MNKPRFTIRMLLGAVALIGSGLAAIRFPTYFCAALTLSVLFSTLVGAIVVAATCRGASRAFALSFALAGCVHFILALTPLFATSRLLLSRYCLDQIAVPLGYAMASNQYVEENTLGHASEGYVPGSPPDRYYKYVVIGQSVFTLLLATAFGVTGRFLYQFRVARDASQS